MQHRLIASLIFALLVALITWNCKHEPIIPNQPIDPPVAGFCDPDSAYFQNQVLPLLVSNCTEAGCHNDQDRQEGVVLTSYESLLATVEHVTQNDWGENKLIKALQESDLDKRMPQNKPPLSTEQINLLKTWVNQGALNNMCNENVGGCDTLGGAKYGTFVQPLIQSRCKGCHSGASPQAGIQLTTYSEIALVALDGRLYSAITLSANWMPKGGSKLDDCTIVKLKTWIDNGAPEN